MTTLLDLMGQPRPPRPAPRPVWRAGQPVPGSDKGYVPLEQNDLRWLTTGTRNHRWVGAWHRWDTRQTKWSIIDPDNRMCINHLPDKPPKLNEIGQPESPI